ncbi:ferredoxin [Nocardia anaemiae]|uniref:ferredoxin n=1 Tax=Nocardia anaemiae TaxID=263910 RepID=UPI0007A482DB|nr:ferredoxin [Nocardia anaemiae]
MHVEVDRLRCVRSGQCVMTAPEVFDQDDAGIVILRQDTPGLDQHDAVPEAAVICPAAAIRPTGQSPSANQVGS